MPIEISIKVSDDDQTLVEKIIVYDNDSITLSHDCQVLKDMVEATVAKFKGQPSDVVVRFKYTW